MSIWQYNHFMWLAQLTQRGNYTWSLIPRPSTLIQLYSSPESFQVVPCCLATQDLSGYTCTVAGMLSCDPGEHLVRLPQLINCFIKSTHITKTVTKSKCLKFMTGQFPACCWSWGGHMIHILTSGGGWGTYSDYTAISLLWEEEEYSSKDWRMFRRVEWNYNSCSTANTKRITWFWCLKVSDW